MNQTLTRYPSRCYPVGTHGPNFGGIMTTLMNQTVTDPVLPRELTLADRCEHSGIKGGLMPECGAQAFVLLYDAVTGEDKLQFCKHHYEQIETNLVKTGWAVNDMSYMINEKPTAPEDSEV